MNITNYTSLMTLSINLDLELLLQNPQKNKQELDVLGRNKKRRDVYDVLRENCLGSKRLEFIATRRAQTRDYLTYIGCLIKDSILYICYRNWICLKVYVIHNK